MKKLLMFALIMSVSMHAMEQNPQDEEIKRLFTEYKTLVIKIEGSVLDPNVEFDQNYVVQKWENTTCSRTMILSF